MERSVGELKGRLSSSEREWELREEEALTELKTRLDTERERALKVVVEENEHLKHKIKEYEKKYQVIIPEVEKLKGTLSSKQEEIEQMQVRLEKTRRDAEVENEKLRK